jgi:cytochrome c-type biogenesis protein
MDEVTLFSVFAAFVAGLISFLSPCVLPLVPGYISIVSGLSLDQLRDQEKQAMLRRTVVLNSVMFIVGFSITFIMLGASATFLGALLVSKMQLLSRIAGLILIIFGLHLTGIFKINALYQDKRMHNIQKPRGMLGAMVLGLAFAFGWSPCIGPILAGIYAIAMTKQTVYQGMFLLAVYSAGLGVPFLMTSLGLNRFLSFYTHFKKHFHAVEVASGVLVMTVGVLIMTNTLARMASWFSFLNDFALYLESFIG